MKFTKTLLAVALVGASSVALADPVNWTGEFIMKNPGGFNMDASDNQAGDAAAVTGQIDIAAGTFSLVATDTFQWTSWTANGGTLYGTGTHTVSVNGDGSNELSGIANAPLANGDGFYTFTVGAGQLGGNINFNWGATSGIDVFLVWDVATSGGVTTYTSTDVEGDGILGARMVDGAFPGFSANFNMQHVAAAPVPEASTYGMMLAGLGLVGFAVRRRKLTA
ncbi:PEP-CTERM sorting domain-containing protein [Thiobacillus denitrificans]|uniref:PEP-CTERM sorting domain-containing protein n=1 Tax=Thiobacillus denitrificans TaxID=36861 RepID=UPI00036C3B78|nr:PEP-CTERM sorting domain-containing protein [Thiobacillus denitrificans]